MGGRAGFSGVISLHHSDAVTDSHLSITSSRTLVGGVPITYKAARAFNKLNVRPHTTKDKLKMSSCLTKRVKKRTSGRLLVACWAAMQQETHGDAVATVPGPDDSRSQRRGQELHPLHHFP